ncbi:MAG: 4-alpha-glucanotransferase [Bacteroidales bacterium]|nr:4-alpha-glucanotransferase [Bacteroidales bacterium]
MKRRLEIHYGVGANERLLVEFCRKMGDKTWEEEMTKGADGLNYFETDDSQVCFYRYIVELVDGRITERHWRFSPQIETPVIIKDMWRSPQDESDVLCASAFRRAVFTTDDGFGMPPTPQQGSLVIVLNDPRISDDEEFCIVSKQFINWNTESAMRMSHYVNDTWVLDLGTIPFMKEFEFKFGILDKKTQKFKAYEVGDNRIAVPERGATTIVAYNGYHYERPWRAAGVAVPVFSLRTHRSRGCGEFLDLKDLADWCVAAGLKVIQLLPINDTTAVRGWRDSYPYNAISVHALHPSYISVEEVYKYYGKRISALEKETGLFLNDSNFLDYNRTRDWKDKNLRSIFTECFDKVVSDPAIQKYMDANESWLRDYAAFAMLRDRYHTPDFRIWPSMSRYSSSDVEAMFQPSNYSYREVWYRVFLQYHLERQLREAVSYCHNKGVALKGDLPIGINPNSADAWTNPQYFDFTLQAGAPPDFFSRDGQNWGFPIYKWEEMKKDGYTWWRARMERMQQFFDAFRIDHILGFFRIWSIPRPFRSGLMGIFSPAIPLKREEVEAWGFKGSLERYTRPEVTRDYLSQQLGEYASLAKACFDETEYGELRLKASMFSPESVDEWVENNVQPTSRERIRQGFANILHEVLFVSVKDGEWHPRIMLTETDRYRRLSESDKSVMKALSHYFFFERHNQFWKEQAESNLGAMLQHCKMLVCGEDLGMIPSSVPSIMQRMQILSLELQRMPKQFWERYGDTSKYPYMSVCATSSHDISSIRGWWEEEPDNVDWYYKNVLKMQGETPRVATENIVSAIVEQHLEAPSMLCINPIQDYAGMIDNMPHLLPFEERINVPSNQNQMWRYRVPFCIDDLVKNYPQFHGKVRYYVEKSGRL